MTSTLLSSVGEAIYGPRWQSDLAADLDVSDRTMRRWVAGDALPSGVNVDLIRLCLERSQLLDDLAKQLKAAV